MRTKGNLPAFPITKEMILTEGLRNTRTIIEESLGMTKRELIAKDIMAAIVGASAFNQESEEMLKKANIIGAEKTQDFIAFMAVGLTEALIEALSK